MSLPLEPSQIAELVKLQTWIVQKSIAYWLNRLDRKAQATQTHILDEPWLIKEVAQKRQSLWRLLTRAAAFPETCEDATRLALLMTPIMRTGGRQKKWQPILESLLLALFDFPPRDKLLLAQLWHMLGVSYQDTGAAGRARVCFEYAEGQDIGHSEGAAELLLQIRQGQAAMYALRMQNEAEALRIALQMLDEARELNDGFIEAHGRATLAFIYSQYYQPHLAFEQAQQALLLWRQYDSPEALRACARVLHYLGDACRMVGHNLRLADEYLGRAEQLVMLQDDVGWLARLKDARAQVARKRGDYQLSIELAQQAMATFMQVGDRRGQVSCLHALGLALTDAHDYAEAEKTLRAASDGWAELRVELERINALYALAYMYYKGPKDLEQARNTYDEAMALAQNTAPSARREQLIDNMKMDFADLLR